jgi:hypothetical protein
MDDLRDRLRSRFVPALLAALGVTFLAAGLLNYTIPVDAGPVASPVPTAEAGVATPVPLITLPPLGSGPVPSASPSAPADRVATRVRVAALDIDLPVIKPNAGYPLCDVAMYFVHDDLGQPGQGRSTYLYAHARTGMFLPLLETSARRLRGLVVEVWTSDDLRFLYEITEVRRGQTDLDDAAAATEEQLWLQTSEGPRGTVGKTQVIAMPLSVEQSTHKAAHPKAKPVDCG